MASDVKYPNVTVQLIGHTSSVPAILYTVKEALRQAGVPQVDRELFQNEALSGDFDHVLQTCMKWVNVE